MLSERNTMEILKFIKKERKIKIVTTLDGKEFMTLNYLDRLIYETCILQKKVWIFELENLINVSSEWIESRIDEITKKYRLFF